MGRGRDGSSRTWVMQGAVVVSILAHASLLLAAGLHRDEPKKPPVEEPAPAVDQWTGNTAMAVGGELHEVDVSSSEVGGAEAPAVPPSPAEAPGKLSPAAEKAPDEGEKPSRPAEKAPDEEEKPSRPAEKAPDEAETPSRPAEKAPDEAETPSRPAEKAKPKEGESSRPPEKAKPKDKEPSRTAEKAKPNEKEPSRTAEKAKPLDPKPPETTETTGGEENPSKAQAASPKIASGEKNGGESGGNSGSFGSEGAPSVRDLGRAFTRALPPACDADPIWKKLEVGKAGSVEVAVIISEEGKITGFEPITENPPTHLLNTLKRTVALLRGGTFALQGGAVTAGRQILRLSAELSDEPVTEEESSGAGAFNLASRWEGKRGVASFTQTTGRHVEITVEFLRVEISSGG